MVANAWRRTTTAPTVYQSISQGFVADRFPSVDRVPPAGDVSSGRAHGLVQPLLTVRHWSVSAACSSVMRPTWSDAYPSGYCLRTAPAYSITKHSLGSHLPSQELAVARCRLEIFVATAPGRWRRHGNVVAAGPSAAPAVEMFLLRARRPHVLSRCRPINDSRWPSQPPRIRQRQRLKLVSGDSNAAVDATEELIHEVHCSRAPAGLLRRPAQPPSSLGRMTFT